MFWSWTFPWDGAESLLGILVADNVDVMNEHGTFTCSLISIGLLIGRVDFLFNYNNTTEED